MSLPGQEAHSAGKDRLTSSDTTPLLSLTNKVLQMLFQNLQKKQKKQKQNVEQQQVPILLLLFFYYS